jgi:hypothetical protein
MGTSFPILAAYANAGRLTDTLGDGVLLGDTVTTTPNLLPSESIAQVLGDFTPNYRAWIRSRMQPHIGSTGPNWSIALQLVAINESASYKDGNGMNNPSFETLDAYGAAPLAAGLKVAAATDTTIGDAVAAAAGVIIATAPNFLDVVIFDVFIERIDPSGNDIECTVIYSDNAGDITGGGGFASCLGFAASPKLAGLQLALSPGSGQANFVIGQALGDVQGQSNEAVVFRMGVLRDAAPSGAFQAWIIFSLQASDMIDPPQP